MSKSVTVDLITDDPVHREFVLHLVEEDPWNVPDIINRMLAVQDRLYDSVDLIIGGHLAEKYPESNGRKIRIQIDCLNEPKELHDFVARFSKHMESDAEYREAIRSSPHLTSLRIIANKLRSEPDVVLSVPNA